MRNGLSNAARSAADNVFTTRRVVAQQMNLATCNGREARAIGEISNGGTRRVKMVKGLNGKPTRRISFK